MLDEDRKHRLAVKGEISMSAEWIVKGNAVSAQLARPRPLDRLLEDFIICLADASPEKSATIMSLIDGPRRKAVWPPETETRATDVPPRNQKPN